MVHQQNMSVKQLLALRQGLEGAGQAADSRQTRMCKWESVLQKVVSVKGPTRDS